MKTHVDVELRDRILSHMVAAVTAAPFSDDPFPHFSTRGFLPDDAYAKLLEMLPADEHYSPFSYEKHQTENGDSNRGHFEMTADSLNRLSTNEQTFWYTVRNAMGSRQLKQAVFAKLAPGLAFRYGVKPHEAVDLDGFALPELFRETEGYTIKPHPDTRKKVVTMQFALAHDESQVSLGTEFYKRSLNPASWLREPRGFDIVKQMQFLPNTVYAFAVLNTITLRSWHGKSRLVAQQGTRNSMLNLWYEKVENACPDLARECGFSVAQSRAA